MISDEVIIVTGEVAGFLSVVSHLAFGIFMPRRYASVPSPRASA